MNSGPFRVNNSSVPAILSSKLFATLKSQMSDSFISTKQSLNIRDVAIRACNSAERFARSRKILTNCNRKDTKVRDSSRLRKTVYQWENKSLRLKRENS